MSAMTHLQRRTSGVYFVRLVVPPWLGSVAGRAESGGTEDIEHPRQGRLGAGAHIERLNSKPHGIHADHRGSACVQAARSAAAETGHATLHRHRTVAPLDLDAAADLAQRGRLRGDRHSHELAWIGDSPLLAFAGRLPPAVHDAAIEAARHRH